MKKKDWLTIAISVVGAALLCFFNFSKKSEMPLVAIANYGPIAPLEASIDGIKKQLQDEGFAEGKDIRYEIADVGFDHSLISQMITKLKNQNPKVMVVMTTPIAQLAKKKIKHIPLVFNVITDPVEAGLIKDRETPDENMTGASDMQDLAALLAFAKSILPQAKTMGLLYATAENNDLSLVKMIRKAAESANIAVMAIPVDQPRDIPICMQNFKGKVDFIYVGASSMLQSAFPTVSKEAQKNKIPLFNMEEQTVKDGLALASYGVDYDSVGRNTGKIVSQILKGADVSSIKPVYPTAADHKTLVNEKLAELYKVKIPKEVNIAK